MGNKRPPYKPDTVYHVYNHGNAEDNIFREDDNYHYFLKRYAHYIYPVAQTYGFCLMPNHFHFMVKIRSQSKLVDTFNIKDPQGFQNPEGLSTVINQKIAHRFGTLLNAYTKSFNSYYNRQGSLFRNTTKRKTVTNETYHKQLIYYIHQNPVYHGFVKSPADWPYSSYHLFLSDKQTQLSRTEALAYFGDRKKFMAYHEKRRPIEKDQFY